MVPPLPVLSAETLIPCVVALVPAFMYTEPAEAPAPFEVVVIVPEEMLSDVPEITKKSAALDVPPEEVFGATARETPPVGANRRMEPAPAEVELEFKEVAPADRVIPDCVLAQILFPVPPLLPWAVSEPDVVNEPCGATMSI